RRAIGEAGGWLPFDRFMAMALYEPGLGYYANATPKFGAMPQGADGQGSDFVTAPELSPLFGHTLARQVAQAMQATGVNEVWEFGAGTGALARQVLDALGALGTPPARYTIADLSGSLRARQQAPLATHAGRVHWADRLAPRFEGIVLGNEVLDAMPVQLIVRLGGVWHERGVALAGDGAALVWADRPTALRPPLEIEGGHDYLTEGHPQAEAFIRTLAEHWTRGPGVFIDYGFPEVRPAVAGFIGTLAAHWARGAGFFIAYGLREAGYYHPQRHRGTLMCHRARRSDGDPLADLGLKDITAHVNFTGIALAAQDAGL